MKYNILFYSKRCPACLNLLESLKVNNFLPFFKLFCIDDNMDNLPKDIKKVPTMIIAGSPRPYEGADTFKWVQSAKFFRQQQYVENTKRIIRQNAIRASMNTMGGPLGYVKGEMGGMSDEYAFKDKDVAPAHTFYKCDQKDTSFIITPPDDKNKKINENEFKAVVKDQENVREQQDDKIKTMMETDQLVKIIRNTRQQNMNP